MIWTLHPADELGRVRVALLAGEGVVLAVHGHPLAGLDARRDPGQEPEHPLHGRCERHAPGGRGPGAGTRWCRRSPATRRRIRPPRRSGGWSEQRSSSRSYLVYLPVGRPDGQGTYDSTRDAGVRARRGAVDPRSHPGRGHGAASPSTATTGTSLNDIAAEVGIRRPSLLHHFPSKEALYGRSSSGSSRTGSPASRAPSPIEVRGWEQVELVLNAGFRFFADNPAYVRLMRREAIDRARTSASTWPPPCVPTSTPPPATSGGRWTRAGSASTTPTSCSSPATARCSATSATPPSCRACSTSTRSTPTRCAERLDHIITFFRAALVP